jgi:drug/metabolite transporter (DMT)-like permease
MTAMQDSVSGGGQNLWLAFAMISVVCWGLYGILLHSGQLSMGDPEHGRMKAFLWVGIAYLLVAVLAPAAVLLSNGASWSMPSKGILWSLVAGAAGAAGAFGVLLAFGAKGHPAVVMSIIFAGAPMVNAIVSLWLHPPQGGWSSIQPQFFIGILLAAIGGLLITLYKPGPPPPQKNPPATDAPRG